jgi:hypothetical protein
VIKEQFAETVGDANYLKIFLAEGPVAGLAGATCDKAALARQEPRKGRLTARN